MPLHAYQKLGALGNSAYADTHRLLWQGPPEAIVVQEKVDGSQFSFGLTSEGLECRSKGAQLDLAAPPDQFAAAVATVQALADRLQAGLVYRGEVLSKPRHNTLAYDRVPRGNVVLWDVEAGAGNYLSPELLALEAGRLGLEVVRTLATGPQSREQLEALVAGSVSMLGGCKVEGVVVKNYSQRDSHGERVTAKLVGAAFKEVLGGAWRASNPTAGDVVSKLVTALRTPARWAKAVQHLRDAGALVGGMRDMPALVREVQSDTWAEERQRVLDALEAYAKPHILRQLTHGLAEWYQRELAGAFEPSVSDGIMNNRLVAMEAAGHA